MAAKSQFVYKKRFQSLNRALTNEERKELEASIAEDGVLEPVTLMQGDILVDGYNRDAICLKLGKSTPFRIKHFKDEAAAELWAIRKQLARRNLSPADFKLFLGRLYNAEKADQGRPKKTDQNDQFIGGTAEKIGEEYAVSTPTVRRAGKYVEAYDSFPKTIQKFIDTNPQKVTEKDVIELAKKDAEKQQQLVREVRTGDKDSLGEALGRKKPKKAGNNGKPRDEVAIARSRAIKTIEAMQRAIDDLHAVKPNTLLHGPCMAKAKAILTDLKGWK